MSAPSVFHHPVFGPSGEGSGSAGSAGSAGSPGGRAPVPLSMIDVVFLMLIFLLVGQFPLAEGLLSMPLAGSSAQSARPEPAQTLWVGIIRGPDGQLSYRLNDWQPPTGSPDELLGHVRDWSRASGPGNLAVVITAEPGVPFEELVRLWEGCRQLGIEQLALPASPQPSPDEIGTSPADSPGRPNP